MRQRLFDTVKEAASQALKLAMDPSRAAERWGAYDAMPNFLARSRGAMRLTRATLAKEPAPVAPTPMVLVDTLGSAGLYRYESKHKRVFSRPILMCPSVINRPYIHDLTDGNSLVQGLQAAGHEVYTIDWGDPGEAEENLDWSDFIRGRLRHFVDETNVDAQSDALHLVGHCLGGTLATALVALEPEGIETLTNLTVPVDFDDGGMLSAWSRMPFFDPKAFADVVGHVPTFLTQPAFQFLRPLGTQTKNMRLVQNLGDERFLEFYRALETWVNDNVAIPKGFYVELIQRLYRDNAMVAGTWILAGERVDLANITIPALTICAQKDHIVPVKSARAGHDAYGSAEKEIEIFGGGHIGVVVGSAAQRRLWPRLCDWFEGHAHPDDRLQGHVATVEVTVAVGPGDDDAANDDGARA